MLYEQATGPSQLNIRRLEALNTIQICWDGLKGKGGEQSHTI